MSNPWLKIPASDYEAHMALPEVAQAQALDVLFASALAEYAPASLAVLGCTTGRGFEQIDTIQTRRVVGIDINPKYLAILRSKYGARIPDLEVIEGDFTAADFQIRPVSMVFAALVFEYVNTRDAVINIERCMAAHATLVAVLQLPSAESAPVTATQYTSLELLAPLMRLVPPNELLDACADVGLVLLKEDTIPLKKGKAFYSGHFRKDG
jgi:hypothetical protein